jgi:hypothetical protein
MEKQKKNFKKKNNFKFKKSFSKKLKNLFFINRILKEKFRSINKLDLNSTILKNLRLRRHLLSITIKSNNIFCNLHNVSVGKLIKRCSSGLYKLNTSRKKLKFNINLILIPFLNSIKSKLNKKICFISITAPIKIRKNILFILGNNLQKKNLIIEVNNKKCFNGCRPAKKKRKKQKGQRFFK